MLCVCDMMKNFLKCLTLFWDVTERNFNKIRQHSGDKMIFFTGSHDSMTYSITRASGLAPDAEPVLKRLYPLFRGTILRWTITQSLDTLQQLLIGIRYLPSTFTLKLYQFSF